MSSSFSNPVKNLALITTALFWAAPDFTLKTDQPRLQIVDGHVNQGLIQQLKCYLSESKRASEAFRLFAFEF